KRCPPSACNAPRENCWRENRVGVGGGPQELFREPKSRVDAPLRGTSSGRSAPDQFDPALAEGRRFRERRGSSKRRGDPAGRFGQRTAEQCISSLCARSVVRAGGQAATSW